MALVCTCKSLFLYLYQKNYGGKMKYDYDKCSIVPCTSNTIKLKLMSKYVSNFSYKNY